MALFQNLLLGECLLLAEERKTFARMRSVPRRLGLRRPTRLIGRDAGIGEPYNDFRSLFAAGHHRDRPFDGSEKRLTGISDLPARIVPKNK